MREIKLRLSGDSSVALTVTAEGFGTTVGAVYCPVASIVPHAAAFDYSCPVLFKLVGAAGFTTATFVAPLFALT